MVPSPRQQFVDLLDGMVGDPTDDVGQIGLGIDAVHLAGCDDRIHAGSTLSACVRAAEEVALPPEDRRLHGGFGGIFADLKPVVGGVADQRRPGDSVYRIASSRELLPLVRRPEYDSEHLAKANLPMEKLLQPGALPGCNAIDRMFRRLKDYGRIATRYDKCALNFMSTGYLAAIVSY